MSVSEPAAVVRHFYALIGQVWAMPPPGINGGISPLWDMGGI